MRVVLNSLYFHIGFHQPVVVLLAPAFQQSRKVIGEWPRFFDHQTVDQLGSLLGVSLAIISVFLVVISYQFYIWYQNCSNKS